jgi:hypothetical protein
MTGPTIFRIEGWAPPGWATKHVEMEASLAWFRESDTELERVPSSVAGDDQMRFVPSIQRYDNIDLDLDAGELSLNVGPTLIHLDDDLEVTPAEARKLAVVLIELADAAELP